MPRGRRRKYTSSRATVKKRKTENNLWKASVPDISLLDLHNEILLLLCEYLAPQALVRLGKTCTSLHELCGSEIIWKRKCRMDFGLVTCGHLDYITLYELYFKLMEIGERVFHKDENKNLGKGDLSGVHYCWFMIFRSPPDVWFINPSRVSKTTAQRAFMLKGLKDLNKVPVSEQYYDRSRGITYYTWSALYDIALAKYGTLEKYQKHVILRFTPYSQSYLNDQYQMHLGQQQRNKVFDWLHQEDNQSVNYALGRNFPNTFPGTYAIIEGHEIFRIYQNRKLAGGLDAIREYAYFCRDFADWVEKKSTTVDMDENLCRDYRESINFAVKELKKDMEVRLLSRTRYLRKAKIHYNRIVHVWTWFKQLGPQEVVSFKYESSYRNYLETGRWEYLQLLQNKVERTGALRQLLLDNEWMVSVLPKESLRPLQCSNLPLPLMLSGERLVNDPDVSRLVQKFLQTGSKQDFYDILRHLSNQVDNYLNLHTRHNDWLKRGIETGRLSPRLRAPSLV